MFSVLIEGTLTATPVQRTSSKGTPFTTAQMRANGDDGETVWCSVIAFSTSTAEALSQLASGDTVAIAGPAALSQWEKDGQHRVSLKVTATRVLTVYEAGTRRKAASQAPDRGNRGGHRPTEPDRGRRGERGAATTQRPGRFSADNDGDGPC